MSVHTAADCSASAVQALEAGVSADTDGVIEVVIPPCTGGAAGHWGNSIPGAGYIYFNMPSTATLMEIHGAGSASIDGGGDATVIYDEKSSNNDPIFIVTPNSTGGIARVYGISFIQTNSSRGQGSLSISGFYNDLSTPQRFRVDHCTFTSKASGLGCGGRVIGVIDHNVFHIDPGIGIYFGSWGDSSGDAAWAEPTALGSDNFPVIEDNTFTVGTSEESGRATGGIEDSYRGTRFVIRFNDSDRAATQTHPTGGSGRARGSRAWEIYGNKFSNDGPNPGIAEFNVFFLSSGTGVVWGNDAGVGLYDNFISAHVNRRDGVPYDQGPPPEWGYCGPSYRLGTVTTNGVIVTRDTGADFDTDWPAGSRLTINSTDYTLTSVESTDQLTLTSSAGLQISPVDYVMGSNYDGNVDTNTGYPCIDQIGRGMGDLLTGYPAFNSATSQDYTNPGVYPRQALEPVYIWSNTYNSGASQVSPSEAQGVALPDRDYYVDTGSHMGVGATLPGTCAVGDGYYKTGVGTWKTATPAHGNDVAQGLFYKCTSTNTWTLYYTPLEYPHPYIALTSPPADGVPIAGYALSTSSPAGLFS